MPNNSNNGIHAQRLKEIRPYITFNYDLRHKLTKSQKATIKKYYDAIERLSARPNKIYRARNKKHLKAAQQYAQHPKGLPGIKVAFIPTADDKAKVTFNKRGKVILKTGHVSTIDIDFDLNALLNSPREHIEQKIKENPRASAFTLKADEYEIPSSHSPRMFPDAVINIMNKYSNEKANNYYGNWMFGAKAHFFTNQSDFTAYQRDKDKKKSELRKRREAAKKRKQRKLK